MKKVLVTGAAGYIGRHVVNELLQKKQKGIVTDVDMSCFGDEVEKISVNLFEKNENIYEELGKPDVCIHLAWKDGFSHKSHAHMGNLSGHYEFIKNMLAGGLPQIVIMGSMHEVGYWEGAVTEDTPTNPLSYYGIAKNALREAARELCKEYNAVYQWTRAYYILGDDLKNHSIFSKLIEAEENGQEYFPFTSGKNKYDFMDIDELAEQIVLTALQTEIDGVINCCSGIPMSLGDKVEEFIKSHDFKIKLKYGAFPDRPYDSPGIWGDNTKINKIIKNYRSTKGERTGEY